jgi:hypothetical protein
MPSCAIPGVDGKNGTNCPAIPDEPTDPPDPVIPSSELEKDGFGYTYGVRDICTSTQSINSRFIDSCSLQILLDDI